MKIDPNQPAYPLHPKILNPCSSSHQIEKAKGMSIRAEIASRAMEGMLANSSYDSSYEHIAKGAVIAADALIAELNKWPQQTSKPS